MRNAGLGSWPERRLRISPERDAIWFEGRTTSHAGFAERVRRTAGALAGLGVRAGDRVAWISGNHPSALETLYACGQLGAIWVPVNARLTAPEARYVLEHSGSTVVVHGRDSGVLADALRDVVPTWVAAEPPTSGGADSLPYEQLLAAAQPERRDEPVSLDDPCLVMYTSGTTGRPKGAVLTHGNMTWNAANQLLGFDFTPTERTLALAPLFHIGGLNGTVNPTLLRGGCAVVVRGFDPAGTLAVIEEQRVTSFFAVPTVLDAMAREPGFRTRDLSALRTIGAAGAPLPLPTLRTWLDRGVTVQQAYGMTEAAPGCTVLDSADAVRKVGSAGKPVFFTDVQVVRPDGSPAGVDEVGEVLVSGPNVMAGYWNDPEQTAAVLSDGWYATGDAGSFDVEGFLYIRDRYKDMIISGGENVYPAEVESALLELPGVLEAAVIGVPDQRWGEVGLAVLVAAPDAERDPEAVRTALRERLAGFKVPRHVHFVDELPKTATGKIRKPDLRAGCTGPR
ncbi:p-hydroxycinnamoyl-CoA synthetase [Geodermatophilus sp. TF02-6]|uniref:acyl-CoA synthetase n=1 Tax=Geodermatophilus sp. TF02-6 TaxID=2250575 RepID=UPI000DEAFC38|nr:long-chain fatty acid--CoA ligase [Geodermatophilus sp. TF02-6]RBY83749.1 p-hydroxycinnamoyl-CoA synthetase [Geodermatophilus sp. TF02-6]